MFFEETFANNPASAGNQRKIKTAIE